MSGPSSSSNSTTTQTTQQQDQRVAASENGVAVGAYANVKVDATTPAAFDVAKQAVTSAENQGTTLIADAFQFGKSSLDLVNQTQQQLVDFVTQRTQTEATTLAQDAFKLLMPIGVGIVVVMGLKAVK